MKKALIHIGPHKTGSTYIQKMMQTNAHLLAPSHQFFPKSDPLFDALQRFTLGVHNSEDATNSLKTIHQTAYELGRSLTAPNTLISSEDLLGPVPTLAKIYGLYPFLHLTLPAIQAGFDDAEVETQFFCYIREYQDWLRSVHAHKFRDKKRTFAPRKFSRANGLPFAWDTFTETMYTALGKDAVVFRSYETDAVSGRLGADMFRYFGIPDAILDHMDWIEPVNVSPRRS